MAILTLKGSVKMRQSERDLENEMIMKMCEEVIGEEITDDRILKLMHNRQFDTLQEFGVGFIAKLRGEDVSALSLVVMPLELFEAIRTCLAQNPAAIDPSVHFNNDDLTPVQLRWLSAFMEFELGIEVDEIKSKLKQMVVQKPNALKK